jgi:hypothetical protein
MESMECYSLLREKPCWLNMKTNQEHMKEMMKEMKDEIKEDMKTMQEKTEAIGKLIEKEG